MHVQIVTFGLGGATERDFIDAAHQAAPAFSALGGLLAKLWLENEEEGRYGAIYLWEDREAMDEAMRRHGHLIEGSGPAYSDAAMEHFSVLENLTRLTQPVLEIVEEREAAARTSVPAGAAAGMISDGRGQEKPGGTSRSGAAKKAGKAAGKGAAPAAKKTTAGSAKKTRAGSAKKTTAGSAKKTTAGSAKKTTPAAKATTSRGAKKAPATGSRRRG